MRLVTALAPTIALALGAAAPAPAQAPDTTPSTLPLPPAAAIGQTTVVKGTPPALEGRWLVLQHVGLAHGGRTILSAWDVTRKNGELELHERHVIPPTAQRDALEKTNATGTAAWEPTQEDLDAIAADWDHLTLDERGVLEMTHEIFGTDAYDDEIKKDPKTNDALWILRQVYSFQPGPARPIKQVNVYATRKQDGDAVAGDFTALTLAAAPFPVPITFTGTFRLIPIGASSGGLLTRIADFFKGCNR